MKAEDSKDSGEPSTHDKNVQSDTKITLRVAQHNVITVKSVDQADTENNNLTTDGNWNSYRDVSWDAENRCFSSKQVLHMPIPVSARPC